VLLAGWLAGWLAQAGLSGLCLLQECEKLGIPGSAVGQELQQLGKQLPSMFEQLVEQLRSSELQETISYYQHFTSYAHGSDAGKALSSNGTGRIDSEAKQQQQQAELPHVLPVLVEIREQRTTPSASNAGPDANATHINAVSAASIDWGDFGDAANNSTATAAPGGINWGLEVSEASEQSAAAAAAAGGISWDLGDLNMSAGADAAAAAGGGISWDVVLDPPADDAAAAAAAAAAGDATGTGAQMVDWDIDMSGIGLESAGTATEAGSGAAGLDWGIEGESASADVTSNPAAAAAAGGSCDASASRLQHDPDYRSQLLDDLQELRAFLVSRKGGLSGSSSNADLLRAMAPELVASTDLGDVLQMLQTVDSLIAALNDNKLRQLLMISSSCR
jgi:hypothetical protein